MYKFVNVILIILILAWQWRCCSVLVTYVLWLFSGQRGEGAPLQTAPRRPPCYPYTARTVSILKLSDWLPLGHMVSCAAANSSSGAAAAADGFYWVGPARPRMSTDKLKTVITLY